MSQESASKSKSTGAPSKENKKKQKTSPEMQKLEQNIARLKLQTLQQQTYIQSLTSKIAMLQQQNKLSLKFHRQQMESLHNQIQQLTLTQTAQQQRIKNLREDKQKSQISNSLLVFRFDQLSALLQQQKLEHTKNINELTKEKDIDFERYESITIDYHVAIQEREGLIKQNQQLKQEIIQLRQQAEIMAADKQRDKLQTIDLLRKQTMDKMNDMRSSLLAIRRDQMDTNTRLTVLQNHQLIEEIQYQGKNTEQIIFKNIQLQQKNKDLTQELALQTEISQELAKRCTVARKLLKSMHQKQQLIEQTNEKVTQKKIQAMKSSTTPNSSVKSPNSSGYSFSPLTSAQEYLSVIHDLQTQLKIVNIKLQKLTEQKFKIQQMYKDIQPQYQFYLKTENDLRMMMIRFLNENIYNNRNQSEQNKSQQCQERQKNKNHQQIKQNKQLNSEINDLNKYDLARLKNISINQWSSNDVNMTVKLLLNFLKPKFTMKNMKAEYVKHSSDSYLASNYLQDTSRNKIKLSHNKTKSHLTAQQDKSQMHTHYQYKNHNHSINTHNHSINSHNHSVNNHNHSIKSKLFNNKSKSFSSTALNTHAPNSIRIKQSTEIAHKLKGIDMRKFQKEILLAHQSQHEQIRHLFQINNPNMKTSTQFTLESIMQNYKSKSKQSRQYSKQIKQANHKQIYPEAKNKKNHSSHQYIDNHNTNIHQSVLSSNETKAVVIMPSLKSASLKENTPIYHQNYANKNIAQLSHTELTKLIKSSRRQEKGQCKGQRRGESRGYRQWGRKIKMLDK